MNCIPLSIFLTIICTISNSVEGLQCYKSACWGDECFGFLERRDRLVDRCPSDARGCLLSFGTIQHDPNSVNHISKWVGSARKGQPIRRETRSCWVPSQTKGGVVPKGELEKCYPTTMNQWLPFEGRMVIVNSLECLCSGNLCNDKIMSRSSSPSRNQLLGRVTIATTLTVAITHSLLYVFLI